MTTQSRREPTSVHSSGSCGCLDCATQLAFEMPRALVDALHDEKLVVFAGAGISTETPLVFPFTFYDDICRELELPPDTDNSFPEVMSLFEKEHGRIALIERAKRRLDYIKSFPIIDRQASSFHRELSSLYPIKDIFTTNWDDYFERECGATPFVTEQDWAFWNMSDRKVFKVHGSMASPGSIVATTEDYRRYYRELNQGLIGAELKRILATKTVLFIGFSFRDSDFNALYSLMKRRLGQFLPRSFIVTLSEAPPPRPVDGLHVIRTGGTHFLSRLKEEFPEGELVPQDRFDDLPFFRQIFREVHHQMLDQQEMRDHPELLFAASYQDGLMDALDHATANRHRGDYHHRCYVESMVESYARIQEDRLESGRLEDVAYIEGYINGLTFVIADDDTRKSVPLFLVFGADEDPKTLEEFIALTRNGNAARLDADALAYAKTIVERLEPGVIFHHTPFLL